MTARAHSEADARDGIAPVLIDFNNPESLPEAVRLARAIAEHVAAFPFEAAASIATDAAALALVKRIDPAALKQLQHDRDVLEVFACMQRQLMRTRARYGT